MEVTLNKSWHLWLANFGEKRIYPNLGTDICEYTRAVLAGSFWALVAGTFITLAAMWVGFSLYDIVVTIFTGASLSPYSIIFLMLIGAFVSLVTIVAYKEWRSSLPANDEPPKPPSFTTVAYRKFKDKTCFRIKFNV